MNEDNLIEIKDFKKIILKVGQVLKAERIKNSEKLIKLEVDLKDEKREIIAGIGKYYQPEDLINKKIIIVVNLKPKKIMNFESQGMLLAASFDNKLSLLTIDKEIENGALIS